MRVTAAYRMYRLNEFGRISYAEEIAAKDDEAAVAQVREMWPNNLKCEIWQGGRLVATQSGPEIVAVHPDLEIQTSF